jgi:hypothetical protein
MRMTGEAGAVAGVVLVCSGHWLGQFAWLGLIGLADSALLFIAVSHLRRYLRS